VVPSKPDTEYELENWLSGAERIVIAGIGNPIRTDDYAGVAVYQGLKGKVSQKVYLVECETVPESFAQQIIDFNPTHVLLVDAAFLGLKPGSFKLAKPEELMNYPAFSTHMLPLRIFCDHIKEMTKAKIALLLIEPESIEFGEGLTSTLKASTKGIADTLIRLVPK
jgi:hydrogenase 3 maturation protease